MHHLEASNLLTHYLSGDLRPGRRKEVEEHLAQCSECAEWVATYSLFTEALVEHPPSLELARFALAPETLDPPSRESCAEHLKRCRECRGQLELVRQAASETRPVRVPAPVRSPTRRRVWVALAASAVLVFGATFALRTTDRLPADYVLANSTLRGDQTILADRSILVEATDVAPGAALKLESEVVAFGDGFSVKNGATLVVVTSASADEDDGSEST